MCCCQLLRSTKKGTSNSFHSFPSDPKLFQKWLIAVNRLDKNTQQLWKPGPHDVLCSKHFEPSCFTLRTQISRSEGVPAYKAQLLPDAVPTLFDVAPAERATQRKRRRENSPASDPQSEERQSKSKSEEAISSASEEEGNNIALPESNSKTNFVISKQELEVLVYTAVTEMERYQASEMLALNRRIEELHLAMEEWRCKAKTWESQTRILETQVQCLTRLKEKLEKSKPEVDALKFVKPKSVHVSRSLVKPTAISIGVWVTEDMLKAKKTATFLVLVWMLTEEPKRRQTPASRVVVIRVPSSAVQLSSPAGTQAVNTASLQRPVVQKPLQVAIAPNLLHLLKSSGSLTSVTPSQPSRVIRQPSSSNTLTTAVQESTPLHENQNSVDKTLVQPPPSSSTFHVTTSDGMGASILTCTTTAEKTTRLLENLHSMGMTLAQPSSSSSVFHVQPSTSSDGVHASSLTLSPTAQETTPASENQNSEGMTLAQPLSSSSSAFHVQPPPNSDGVCASSLIITAQETTAAPENQHSVGMTLVKPPSSSTNHEQSSTNSDGVHASSLTLSPTAQETTPGVTLTQPPPSSSSAFHVQPAARSDVVHPSNLTLTTTAQEIAPSQNQLSVGMALIQTPSSSNYHEQSSTNSDGVHASSLTCTTTAQETTLASENQNSEGMTHAKPLSSSSAFHVQPPPNSDGVCASSLITTAQETTGAPENQYSVGMTLVQPLSPSSGFHVQPDTNIDGVCASSLITSAQETTPLLENQDSVGMTLVKPPNSPAYHEQSSTNSDGVHASSLTLTTTAQEITPAPENQNSVGMTLAQPTPSYSSAFHVQPATSLTPTTTAQEITPVCKNQLSIGMTLIQPPSSFCTFHEQSPTHSDSVQASNLPLGGFAATAADSCTPVDITPLSSSALCQQDNAAVATPAAASRTNTHPPPLPPYIGPWVLPPDAKAPPPRPSLKISRVKQGIVLSWNMVLPSDCVEIASYQLFAYHETNNTVPQKSLWRKVGDVKALPLPMACTLTQFQDGNKYHFAVRAIDVHGRSGQFSEPSFIYLTKAA